MPILRVIDRVEGFFDNSNPSVSAITRTASTVVGAVFVIDEFVRGIRTREGSGRRREAFGGCFVRMRDRSKRMLANMHSFSAHVNSKILW